jgi:hypothetical protein
MVTLTWVVPNCDWTPEPVAVVVVPLVVTPAPPDEELDEELDEEPELEPELDDVVKEMDGSFGLNMSTPVVPTIVATSTMGARLMEFSQRAGVRGELAD